MDRTSYGSPCCLRQFTYAIEKQLYAQKSLSTSRHRVDQSADNTHLDGRGQEESGSPPH